MSFHLVNRQTLHNCGLDGLSRTRQSITKKVILFEVKYKIS